MCSLPRATTHWPLTLEGQAWSPAHILEEANEVWLEDLGAAVVGSHDIQQPPASLAAVPVGTRTQGHLTGQPWSATPGVSWDGAGRLWLSGRSCLRRVLPGPGEEGGGGGPKAVLIQFWPIRGQLSFGYGDWLGDKNLIQS